MVFWRSFSTLGPWYLSIQFKYQKPEVETGERRILKVLIQSTSTFSGQKIEDTNQNKFKISS